MHSNRHVLLIMSTDVISMMNVDDHTAGSLHERDHM